jgi:class 3 adenylate cyclase
VLPPLYRFLDARILEPSGGHARASVTTSDWFCRSYREVAEGIVGEVGNFAVYAASRSLTEHDQRMVIINATYTFLAPVLPDGRPIEAVATLHGERDGIVVSNTEATDADGRVVLAAHGAFMLVHPRSRPAKRATERALLTVLFTDLVGSTEVLSEIGDKRYRELLDDHHALVRRQLELNKGREVNTAGDGFLATFDSPTRAVQCAQAIRDGVQRLGLTIRAGIHTGECEVAGRDVSGLAVHVASRVQSIADSGEILASATVRDLAAGSGLSWIDRGEHELKGVPGRWSLYSVVTS